MKTLKTILKIFQIFLWIIILAFVTWFVLSYICVLCTNLNEAELPFWNFFRVATSY